MFIPYKFTPMLHAYVVMLFVYVRHRGKLGARQPLTPTVWYAYREFRNNAHAKPRVLYASL